MKSARIIRPWRAALLAALPLALAAIVLLALYGLQVVDSETYLAESRNTVLHSETVAGARGRILDRYGRELVTNRISYQVAIDREILVQDPDPNGVLLSLIALTEGAGVRHTDTLPVSDAAPWHFTEMDGTQASRYAQYVSHFELGEDLSASALMDWLREHYSVPAEYSDGDARLAVGVRWELELRTLFGIPDYVFASDLSTNLIAAVSERCYPGVSIVTSSQREYATEYAAHILGRIGLMDEEQVAYYTALGYPMNALVGQDGAEELFEAYLHGTDGRLLTVRNASGEIIESYYTEEPQAGSDVRLTLDLNCQQVTENALASKIQSINADRLAKAGGKETELAAAGAAVVIQVGTGDILASASYPTYNLSTFYDDYAELLRDPAAPMVNRAAMGSYAPGSTFKPVTATAGLTEGIITPDSTIYDRGIIDEYEGYSYKCWIYPGSHGTINVRQALQMSCNYFFYVTGRDVGIDALSRYAAAYGLGQPTGVELPERTGTLASRSYKENTIGESWYVGDTLQASIGQSYNLFTPLQLASYAATIASSGKRYAAHILSSVSGSDGFRYEPNILSTVDASEETFTAIREGMYMASLYGSASYVFGTYEIPVCSKTGTAQLGEDQVNNAVFIAFAPKDDPEIALSVVVEKGGAGSYLAEAAREIFDWYFSQDSTSEPVPENVPLP